jgi:hypothetical protein
MSLDLINYWCLIKRKGSFLADLLVEMGDQNSLVCSIILTTDR